VCNVGVVGYSRKRVSVNKSLQNQCGPHPPVDSAVKLLADDSA
jgi:hypothetical protein